MPIRFAYYKIKKMITQTIPSFSIIGIAVRTSNENGKAVKDIPALWQQFMSNGLLEKIPNKLSHDIYCLYTDYEKDHTKPYTTIIGCKVAHLNEVPEGMIGKAITSGSYDKQVVKGNINEGLVYNAWLKIWDSKLERVYSTDFEIYGEKAMDPNQAEVDIFVAIK
jgi:predicted transcriptional regulator YdeE